MSALCNSGHEPHLDSRVVGAISVVPFLPSETTPNEQAQFIPKTATNYGPFAAAFFGVIVIVLAMKIAEFLARSRQQVVTCLPDDFLHTVAKRMFTHAIGAMPVCELGTRMVGIISERDLVRAFARADWSEMQYIRARDVMTTRIVSCGPDDTMRTAQELMRINHIRHLPVVKDGQVQAMLSMRDTLALRLRESEDEMNVLRDVVAASRHQNP
jgi:CBS domain-containing protein